MIRATHGLNGLVTSLLIRPCSRGAAITLGTWP
jgi:hypothetical protein